MHLHEGPGLLAGAFLLREGRGDLALSAWIGPIVVSSCTVCGYYWCVTDATALHLTISDSGVAC